MKSIDKITFTSPINIEYSSTPVMEQLGEHTSTMELYENNGCYFIEWDIEELEMTENIGIENEGKNVTGYDGVFELPKQAIELLKKNGFDCSEVED